MNNALKNFFNRFSLEQHLLIAVLLGLIFRIIASYFIYTPLAFDDLGHSWLQAINLSNGMPMDLPEYRTPLFPYLLLLFIKLFGLFGLINDPIDKVYAMNLGLGALSLFGILGAYYYCKSCRDVDQTFAVLIYFVSIYAVMPLVATRAGGECFCITFVMLALGMFKNNKTLLGFVFLGVAVLFRYQLGIIYLFYGLFGFNKKRMQHAVIVGVALLIIEAAKDVVYGRSMFGTLLAYVAENQKPYPKAAWYNLILFTLALAAFPFSLIMIKKIKKVYSQHKEAIIAILIILVPHSMVPHKEERFILPILPFLFIFLAGLWSGSVDDPYTRKVFAPVFITLNMAFLLISSFIPSQTGPIDPLLSANRYLDTAGSLLLNEGFPKWGYQVYLRNDIRTMDYKPNMELGQDIRTVFIISNNSSGTLIPKGFKCGEKKTYGTIIDRVLYKLNPKFNNRRSSTVSSFCTRV